MLGFLTYLLIRFIMPTVPFLFEPGKSASSEALNFCRVAEAFHNPLQSAPLAHEALNDSSISLISIWLHLDTNRIASLLGVTPKIFRTHRQRHNVPYAIWSEQARRLTQVAELGKEVFGEPNSFKRWLEKPAYGLAGKRPIALLSTAGGAASVAAELIRIAHGDLT